MLNECDYRKIKKYIQNWKFKTISKEEFPPWQNDYKLIENEGLFQEYLEMGN